MVRVCPGEKTIHIHSFIVYRDGPVKASRLPAYIQEHIRELTVTSMQHAIIMTKIRHNYLAVYASMNQIYKL